MIRPLPRTLFGRMVAILLAGLLLAQLLGAAIQFQDRGQTLSQASGRNTAQRITGIVRLLDSYEPGDRQRLVAILNAPPLRVSLSREPWPDDVWMGGNERLAARLATILRRNLGGERPIRVAVSEEPLPPAADSLSRPAPGGPGQGHGWGRGRFRRATGMGLWPPEGLSFLTQVQLSDGTWAGFDHRIAKEVFAWPWRLLATLGVLLIAVVALSVLAVRWVIRPLSVLAGAADELGRDIHRPPLTETGPTEIRCAARAFNTMQSRIARYIADRTRFLSAISHDLKTPITRMRLRAELLEDPELRGSFLKDLDEMRAMTAAALDFARGTEEAGPVQPVDVHALLESLEADAEDLGRDIVVRGTASMPYPARPLALKRCLSNLVNNALKYGEKAEIRLRDTAQGLEIRVADDGPGLPAGELEKVFEPFYRLEGSRSRDTGGTGLGLSIARNIARAHGGELVLENRPKGGLEAVLTLPR